MTIEVEYSCKGCGLLNIKVAVRPRGGERILEWVKETVSPAVSYDHARRSPSCIAPDCDLAIPFDGTFRIEHVGRPVVN